MAAFSFDRIINIARYYYPMLKRQIILYPIAGIVVGILNLTAAFTPVGILFSGIINSAISFLYTFGPVVFARRSSLVIETMLPATPREKASFVILYSLIGIPLILYVPFYLVIGIGHIAGIDTNIEQMLTSLTERPSWSIYLGSALQNLVPAITCLYVVMRVRHNRALLGMVWSVISMIGLGIVGAVWGIIMALSYGFIDGTCTENDPDAIVGSITTSMGSLVLTVSIISGLYTALMTWLTYRQIGKRQI